MKKLLAILSVLLFTVGTGAMASSAIKIDIAWEKMWCLDFVECMERFSDFKLDLGKPNPLSKKQWSHASDINDEAERKAYMLECIGMNSWLSNKDREYFEKLLG